MVGLGQLNGIGLAPARTDRRLTSRFPLQQEIRYRLLQSRATSGNGVGQTLDVSSGGIRFTTTERLPTGRMIEIAMHWPALLNGSCALQFVARGRVLRSDGRTAAIRIQRYEFRTRSSGVRFSPFSPDFQ